MRFEIKNNWLYSPSGELLLSLSVCIENAESTGFFVFIPFQGSVTVGHGVDIIMHFSLHVD